MHLTAETATKSAIIVNALFGYFKLMEELINDATLSGNEKEEAEERLTNTATILNTIVQYKEAYPDENDYFYIKLNKSDILCLLNSIESYLTLQGSDVSEEARGILDDLYQEGVEFLENFDESKLDEAFVRSLFGAYKNALKSYCEESIEQHVEEGNDEVYVFAISGSPEHHYNLVMMNTVESLHSNSVGDGFEEAAKKGYQSELYNPACFEIECEPSDEFESIEEDVKELFEQFYELTNEYSDEAYKKGTEEYENIIALQSLAYELFSKNSIEVLQEVDFEALNQSHNFCAIVRGYETSEEEFYEYAKQTIPADKIALIFPAAEHGIQDYIDFEQASNKEIIEYCVQYLQDVYLDNVPEGRYYNQEKAINNLFHLEEMGTEKDDPILSAIESFIYHPRALREGEDEHSFPPETTIASLLLMRLSHSKVFSADTQQRLVAMLQAISTSNEPILAFFSLIQHQFIKVIMRTEPGKYPKLETDPETYVVTNTSEYLK